MGAAATWEEAHRRAVALATTHYRLDGGELLFCPTRAREQQFRASLEAVVSYFVGRDERFPEDHGFALDRWQSVRFENTGVVIAGEVAMAMGNYFFAREDGTEAKVEYSFVYVPDEAGALKIQLHHSAMPYSG